MSNEGRELLRDLPPEFPIDEGSENYKLFEPVGKGIERTDLDIAVADSNSTVQTADNIGSLWELAKLVDLPLRSNEGREEYRARTISEFQLNTSRGTADDIITIASILLSSPPESIEYRDSDEAGVGVLGLPNSGIKDLQIDVSDFIDVIQNNAAAGYRIEAFRIGTFEYRAPEDYGNNVNQMDYGYGGIDQDGNPDGQGGTYSGLL